MILYAGELIEGCSEETQTAKAEAETDKAAAAAAAAVPKIIRKSPSCLPIARSSVRCCVPRSSPVKSPPCMIFIIVATWTTRTFDSIRVWILRLWCLRPYHGFLLIHVLPKGPQRRQQKPRQPHRRVEERRSPLRSGSPGIIRANPFRVIHQIEGTV